MTESDHEFDFEKGDWVLIRVRENGTSGAIRAKFVAKCEDIRAPDGVVSPLARFTPPWDRIADLTLREYEAEFEQVDGPDEVNF